MDTITLYRWEELRDWSNQYDNQDRFVFRGQGASSWLLTTSLARHFLANNVASDEWRSRELKMYHIFRERLLSICPGMYDKWMPIDILSLMQHHGTPTRLLDFTYSPLVASYFALFDAHGDSVIWVMDTEYLKKIQKAEGFDDYSGPTHIGGYRMAFKHDGAAILCPSISHSRLSAQRGCFLVPGHISERIEPKFIYNKVTLSEDLVLNSITKLRGLGIEKEFLFPDLDKIAQETNRFSVTGSVRLRNAPV